MTFYYISSNDPDPRNCSCKKFVINDKHEYICGNNEASDYWTDLELNKGYDGACQYLIDHLNKTIEAQGQDIGTGIDGVMICTITAEELTELLNEFGY